MIRPKVTSVWLEGGKLRHTRRIESIRGIKAGEWQNNECGMQGGNSVLPYSNLLHEPMACAEKSQTVKSLVGNTF